MFSYSLSFPFDSFHRRYMTEASTFAGLNVFGSLSSEMTLNRMVLFGRTIERRGKGKMVNL